MGGSPEGKWVSGVKGGHSDLAGLLLGWAGLRRPQEPPETGAGGISASRQMG